MTIKTFDWRRIEFGKNSRLLFRSLLSLSPFFILARLLTAAGQLVAGRWLGPHQYGLVTLAVATSAILTIPLNLGFAPGMVKFTASEERAEARAVVISTAVWINLIIAIPCLMIMYWPRRIISSWLHLDVSVFVWSLAYSGLISAYTLISSIPQALSRMNQRGWAEFIYGGAAFLLFFPLYFALGGSYVEFMLSLIIALTAAIVVVLYWSRDHIFFTLDLQALRKISSYFLSTVVANIFAVFVYSVSPLILASRLSTSSAGVLSMYEFGSLGVAAVLSQILVTVLMPLASSPARQNGAWKKMLLLSVPSAFLCFLLLIPADYAALKLVGRGYPIHLSWIAVFSAAGALSVIAAAANTLLTARDASSVWLGTLGCIFGGPVSLGTLLWAIPRYGFIGAGLAALATYAFSFLWATGCGLYKIYSSEQRLPSAARL